MQILGQNAQEKSLTLNFNFLGFNASKTLLFQRKEGLIEAIYLTYAVDLDINIQGLNWVSNSTFFRGNVNIRPGIVIFILLILELWQNALRMYLNFAAGSSFTRGSFLARNVTISLSW